MSYQTKTSTAYLLCCTRLIETPEGTTGHLILRGYTQDKDEAEEILRVISSTSPITNLIPLPLQPIHDGRVDHAIREAEQHLDAFLASLNGY